MLAPVMAGTHDDSYLAFFHVLVTNVTSKKIGPTKIDKTTWTYKWIQPVSPQNFGCIPAAQVSERSGCIQYAAGAKGQQKIYNSAPTNPDIISKETQ